jgi:hypothetical protein
LAEFGITAVCDAGDSAKVDLEVFTSRTGVLKIWAVGVDRSAGEGGNSDDNGPAFCLW